MKKLLIILLLCLLSFTMKSQYTYLAVVLNIETADSAKCVCELLKDLRVKDCEFSEQTKTFTIKTKTLLPSPIIYDYLGGNGYTLVTFFMHEENTQIYNLGGANKKLYYRKDQSK